MNEFTPADAHMMRIAANLLEGAFPAALMGDLGVDEAKRGHIRDLIAELRSRATTPADPAQIGLDL